VVGRHRAGAAGFGEFEFKFMVFTPIFFESLTPRVLGNAKTNPENFETRLLGNGKFFAMKKLVMGNQFPFGKLDFFIV
jgi:hypothetical protein